MKRPLIALLLLVAACATNGGEPTTSVPASPTTTTPPIPATTAPPVECPAAPYQVSSLPIGIGTATLDADKIDPDVWTSVGGTRTTFWGRNDGTVALALIRGALPAVDWPGEKGEIKIDGTPGVVGPHPDGTWVAAWYEQPGERCDLYTMVFYPPWNPADVQATLNGMNRVGG